MASQHQKPKSSYHLDHQLLVELANLIETLTTSGSTNLDQECMKKVKRICKKSDGYVGYAHKQLMNQLEQEHAEIRLSSFQVMNELFQRSHHFRELLVAEMQIFLLLTVETDVDFPLPPPRAAAELLKQQTLVAIADWNSKFGLAYKKLGVGYNFLKHCKKINFDSIIAGLEAERERERNRAELEEQQRQENFSKAVQEMTEVIPEIDKCLQETESCYNILFPKNLFTMEAQSPTNDNVHGEKEPFVDFAGHGRSSHSSKVSPGGINDSQSEGQNIETNSQGKFAKATTSDVNAGNKGGCTSHFEGSQCNSSEAYPENEMEPKSNLQASNSAKEIIENGEVENATMCDQTGGSGEDGKSGEDGEKSDESELEAEEEDSEVELEEEDAGNHEMQSHGVRSLIHNVSIDIEIPTEGVMLVEDDNNTDLLNALDDARKLLSSKYLKQVELWIESFKKANKTETDFFKKCVDMQRSLKDALAKYSDLKIKREPKARRVERVDPDSDEEFEDVPEKEGYEPVIDEARRAEYGLPPLNPPSTSTSASSLPQKAKRKIASSSNYAPDQKHHQDWHPLLSCEHDPKDPTSSAATLAVLEKKLAPLGSKRPNSEMQDDGAEVDKSDTVPPQKLVKQKNEHLLARAPVIPFGMDLEHWQTPGGVKAPVIFRPQTDNRIWTSNSKDEEVVFEKGKEELTRRVFSFTGSFVPVKWTCRAPLPSGKLCERMDRLKCPFHGKIIPRNEDGSPSEPVEETKVKVESDAAPSEDAGELPLPAVEMPSSSWQDPELLRDIEAATGLNLTIKKGKGKQVNKKGKGKGKGKKGAKKYPGLTDLTLKTNTSRKRLEKRVFNKSAMKRVNAKLTAIDNRRVRDKFSNQFHYALKS